MYKPHLPREDEPFFALLGRDDVAPHFARAYGYYLQGHVSLAQQELAQIGVLMSTTETLPGNHPKVRSCFEMADEMTAYHRKQLLAGMSGGK